MFTGESKLMREVLFLGNNSVKPVVYFTQGHGEKDTAGSDRNGYGSIATALGRETSDPAVHAQLAELYNRWGLNDLALTEQELLVKLEPDDESHLTALGGGIDEINKVLAEREPIYRQMADAELEVTYLDPAEAMVYVVRLM